MSRIASTFALVAAWLCANGTMWDAMQIVAWGKMFVGYSETMSLPQALRETFDLSKPCALCKKIAKAKQTQRHESAPTENTSIEKQVLVLDTVQPATFLRTSSDWNDPIALFLMQRRDDLPLRPPRV